MTLNEAKFVRHLFLQPSENIFNSFLVQRQPENGKISGFWRLWNSIEISWLGKKHIVQDPLRLSWFPNHEISQLKFNVELSKISFITLTCFGIERIGSYESSPIWDGMGFLWRIATGVKVGKIFARVVTRGEMFCGGLELPTNQRRAFSKIFPS